jgi:hypothetical protein
MSRSRFITSIDLDQKPRFLRISKFFWHSIRTPGLAAVRKHSAGPALRATRSNHVLWESLVAATENLADVSARSLPLPERRSHRAETRHNSPKTEAVGPAKNDGPLHLAAPQSRNIFVIQRL